MSKWTRWAGPTRPDTNWDRVVVRAWLARPGRTCIVVTTDESYSHACITDVVSVNACLFSCLIIIIVTIIIIIIISSNSIIISNSIITNTNNVVVVVVIIDDI
jgi:hypothetical protein